MIGYLLHRKRGEAFFTLATNIVQFQRISKGEKKFSRCSSQEGM